jgi:hypothetical protein
VETSAVLMIDSIVCSETDYEKRFNYAKSKKGVLCKIKLWIDVEAPMIHYYKAKQWELQERVECSAVLTVRTFG